MIILIFVAAPLVGAGLGLLLGSVAERFTQRAITAYRADRTLNDLIRRSRK